jgi:hypothetical protein
MGFGTLNLNILEFQEYSLNMLSPLVNLKVILCFEMGLVF